MPKLKKSSLLTLPKSAKNKLHGLPPLLANHLRQVQQSLERNDLLGAETNLLSVIMQAPNHPEVLYWAGLLYFRQGHFQLACERFLHALKTNPVDVRTWCALSACYDELNDSVQTFESLRSASLHSNTEATWLQVGIAFDRLGYVSDALRAAEMALAVNSASGRARLLRARCMQALGQSESAATDYRSLINKQSQFVAHAWFALLDQKTIQISGEELNTLSRVANKPNLTRDEKTLLQFALGKALEDAKQFSSAFESLVAANTSVSSSLGWDYNAFSNTVNSARSCFEQDISLSNIQQGSEVIFIVGLPRSGSTLFEQSLAAHPSVEAASELPYIKQVLDEESARRRKIFPLWCVDAKAEDWARLGKRYLQLSARWRESRPISTDKMPTNWIYAGAIRAMLPNAKIIDCRRAPIETLWSCYKQFFAPGMADFSYDFESLAKYWKDYVRLIDFWCARYPQQLKTFSYEDFIAEPEFQIKNLLAFCELPFDSACLTFQQASRSIRTPSASQVRQPLKRSTAVTGSYGDLLQPLRNLLEDQKTD